MPAITTSPQPGWAAEDPEDDGPGVLDALRRYRIGVILTVVLGALTGLGLSLLQPTRYAAETRVFLEDPSTYEIFERGGSGLDEERRVRNAAELALTDAVARRVADLLRTRLPIDELRERYTAEAATDQDLFVITALDPTPEGAVRFADIVADAYAEEIREQNSRATDTIIADLEAQLEPLQDELDQLRRDLDPDGAQYPDQQDRREVLTDQVGNLEGEIQRLRVERSSFDDGLRLIDRAALPTSPVQPQPARAAAAAGLVALAIASGVAWWRNRRVQTAEHRQDPARVLHAPLLGEVPDFRTVGLADAIPAASAPLSWAGEAYQFIVASLSYSLQQTGGRTVLITSAVPGDGKSVTALNLAVAASRDERSVVLIDADLRLRGLSHLANVTAEAGLTDLRDGTVPLERVVARAELPGGVVVPLVPGGSLSADHAGFFRTAGFRTALSRVKSYADLVLVDSAPLLAVAETSAIAGQVDGIVLVVSRGTRLHVLAEVAHRLSFVGTPLLGYVFNRGQEQGSNYAQYYSAAPGSPSSVPQAAPAQEATRNGTRPAVAVGNPAAAGAAPPKDAPGA